MEPPQSQDDTELSTKNMAEDGVLGIVGNKVAEKLDDGKAYVAEKTMRLFQVQPIATTDTLKQFNDKFDDPEFKAEFSESVDNMADMVSMGLDAMDEPIDKAIDKLSDAGARVASGVGAGAVKVGVDLLGAVPFIGAVIDLGRALNDGSKAVASVAEASDTAAKALDEFVDETKDNFDKIVEEKRKQGDTTAQRTVASVETFQHGGTRKRRRHKRDKTQKTRWWYKRRATRRVHFAL